jgi:transposase
MLTFAGHKVYLACGSTDMRKEINGLVLLVEMSFKLDPFDAFLFVFCNRNRDRLKILEWDGDGFWIHFKRLEKGRFTWPLEGDTMELSAKELYNLLGHTKLSGKLCGRRVTERIAV